MPTSSLDGKKEIKEWFDNQTDINTILDIGVGEGTYRKLLGGNARWIGIEVWEPYVEQYNLKELYDEIIIDDARTITLPRADLIIMGDVLEHMEKSQTKTFVERVKDYKHIIASVPLGNWEQGAVNGNIHETHLSEWSMRELEELFISFPIKKRIGGIGIFIK